MQHCLGSVQNENNSSNPLNRHVIITPLHTIPSNIAYTSLLHMPLREIPFRFFEALCILLFSCYVIKMLDPGIVIEDSSRWDVSETELEKCFSHKELLAHCPTQLLVVLSQGMRIFYKLPRAQLIYQHRRRLRRSFGPHCSSLYPLSYFSYRVS